MDYCCAATNRGEMVELSGTVPTGLEAMSRGEVKEKLGVDAEAGRGRVSFHSNDISKALELHSIDNLHVVILRTEVPFTRQLPECAALIRDTVKKCDWGTGLTQWEKAYGKEFPGSVSGAVEKWKKYCSAQEEPEPVSPNPNPSANVDAANDATNDADTANDADAANEKNVAKFRVTCNRAGSKAAHCFSSQQMAGELGHELIMCFGWTVSMKEFDVEIILNIDHKRVAVAVAVTRESLHKRNIAHFGPTTLRATLCYNLLRLAEPRNGMTICDPMCGGGSIPIEGALEWTEAMFLAGDNYPQGVERTRENVRSLQEKGHKLANLEIFCWDATELPLASESVDAIVTDLPFGKKMGTTQDNRVLYPKLLQEWARVVKTSGSVVALTQDRRNFFHTLKMSGGTWKQKQTHTVNVGGLETSAFLLTRS